MDTQGKQLINSFQMIDIKSKTFTWIKNAIYDFKPNLVIIEGFESSKGYSPNFLIEKMSRKLSGWYLGESFYAASTAFKNNIPFLGGEPNDIMKSLEAMLPVIASFKAGQNSGGKQVNHAMNIVGYKRVNSSIIFSILNTWGGNKLYGIMEYKDMLKCLNTHVLYFLKY